MTKQSPQRSNCHCEEQSDEAISSQTKQIAEPVPSDSEGSPPFNDSYFEVFDQPLINPSSSSSFQNLSYRQRKNVPRGTFFYIFPKITLVQDGHLMYSDHNALDTIAVIVWDIGFK